MNFKSPFFIAEISSNHAGSISNAKKLMLNAKKNGADAVKIQTYTANTITINSNKKYFKIKEGMWKGENLWDLYSRASTPLEWHDELFKFAKKNKIVLFSTPFDPSSVDYLEKLNCPFYKIASFEITDFPLIKKIAQTQKPIIMSTGTASLSEIKYSYNYARKNGAKKIILLYCVSNYPSNVEDFNLYNIEILKKTFKCPVGLSDHSLTNEIAYASVFAGAEFFEKHIALKNIKSLDYKFSLKGSEINKYKEILNKANALLGKKYFFRSKSESNSKFYRKSIFSTKQIKRGENFTRQNIRVIRPGIGISSYYYEKLIGKKSPVNINYAEPIKINIIKKLKLEIFKRNEK